MTAVPSSDDSMHDLVIEPDEDSHNPSATADAIEADFVEALAACRHDSRDLFRACVSELSGPRAVRISVPALASGSCGAA